jgi:HEAT repeat protein
MRVWLLGLVVVTFAARSAHGYAVGPAIPLEELAKRADLVVKATVVSTAPVTDPYFDKVMGYEGREAELLAVSALKGKFTKTIRFRYYAPVPNSPVAGYSPLAYTLEPKRTYLFFAVDAGNGVYRQFDKNHTQLENQGLMLALDARPHRGKSVTLAVRAELLMLLTSKQKDDVLVGIRGLDALSGGGRSTLKDLDRKHALAAIKPMILSKDPEVASAAMSVFATDSPYLDDRLAQYWLAGFGSGLILGVGELRVPKVSTADTALAELVAVATKSNDPDARATAIRVLGRSPKVPDATVLAWTNDSDAGVRAAAILISAERTDRSPIRAGATDASAEIRAAAALAIGYAQDPQLLSLLGPLVGDKNPNVSAAAALALLSFSFDLAKPLLVANLQGNWKPLFVNALASKDAAPYLAHLVEIIEKQLVPATWWGGSTPAGVSWELLFSYVKSRPAADLAAGKLDRYLVALEKMRWFSSSEPRKLYALYVLRGLAPRAKTFRATMKKSVTYDIDYYFDMADRTPANYVDY